VGVDGDPPAISEYLQNDGHTEMAQHIAGHCNAKTMGVCDRRDDDVTLDEIERIRT